MNSVKYLLFYMELFCDMFGSVLECYELTHISWSSLIPRQDHASLSTPQLSRESCKSEHALLPHWLCNQKHPSWPWYLVAPWKFVTMGLGNVLVVDDTKPLPNQFWHIINWIPRDKPQRNSNQNFKFSQNAFENVLQTCSRFVEPRCVKWLRFF